MTRQTDGSYGMLPRFVESLGGKFVQVEGPFQSATWPRPTSCCCCTPTSPGPTDTLERVWDYVRGGGSLLLAADPAISEGDSRSSFNDVLRPTAMQVRYDTAVTRTGNWEQSYDVLAHPATAGIDDLRNRFGFNWARRSAPAGRPGRCWWGDGVGAIRATTPSTTGVSYYNAGKPLGDLVLAAEQPFGGGRIFVLGDTSPLQNEMLANCLSLRRPPARLSGQSAVESASLLAAIAGPAALVAMAGAAWPCGRRRGKSMLTPRSWPCRWSAARRPLIGRAGFCPTAAPARPATSNNIAYIDASHLEAYSGDLQDCRASGIAGLLRTLMRARLFAVVGAGLTAGAARAVPDC